jgi:hypothetical protein
MPDAGPCSDRVGKIAVRLDHNYIDLGGNKPDLAVYTCADAARGAVFQQNDRPLEGFFKQTIEAIDRIDFYKVCGHRV